MQNDRDRLIELLKPHVSGTACLCESGSCELTSCRDCKARRLADHLLANGVIVLPCKVGDTVYSFCDTFGVILPYFIENFAIGFLDKDRNYWFWEANSYATEPDELLDEIDFDLDDIGKTVFLTKEEAEQNSKELIK